jgi:curved DNA-binding protein CbpA
MTPFQILGIQPGATHEEIKRAFRTLVSIHHPDKPTGNAEKFKDITRAYAECLKPTHIHQAYKNAMNDFIRQKAQETIQRNMRQKELDEAFARARKILNQK